MSGIHALILAAGAGSRFGGGKLMAPWRGGVLLDGALDAAFTAPVQAVHVVVGADPAGAVAAAPVFEGRLGNPAALSAALFPKVLTLEGDRGARALIEGLGAWLVRIPAPDSGVLYDVDRPEDLDRE